MRWLVLLLCVACEHGDRAPAPTGRAALTGIPVGRPAGGGTLTPERVNPLADDHIAEVDGRKLFVAYNCVGCHGGRAGGGMGPSLRDPDWIYGDSDLEIYGSIVQGRAHGMPAWGLKLPDEQVWKLVAYIKSLRTDHEPEPPQ